MILRLISIVYQILFLNNLILHHQAIADLSNTHSLLIRLYLRGHTRFGNGPLMVHQCSIVINRKFDILANTHRVWTNAIFLII